MISELDKTTLRRLHDLEAWQDRYKPLLGETEGLWTPAFRGTATAGVFNYSLDTWGVFSQIGTVVFLAGRIGLQGITVVPVGGIEIVGLPRPCESNYDYPVTFGTIHNFNYQASSLGLKAYVSATRQAIVLTESFDSAASAAVDAATFTVATVNLRFSGWYRTP